MVNSHHDEVITKEKVEKLRYVMIMMKNAVCFNRPEVMT